MLDSNKSTNQLEACIKRDITKLYKEGFGKGPDETNVKILNNILVIQLDGALTPMEENLRLLPEGENIIYKIRETLMNQNANQYITWLEESLKAKVDGVRYLLCKEKSTIYIFVVFQGSIC